MNPNSATYDLDMTSHVIFAQEWFHLSTRAAFVLHHWDTGKNKADNILVNGKGVYGRNGTTPPAVFEVRRGMRYRFRVMSPGFTLCPIQVRKEFRFELNCTN